MSIDWGEIIADTAYSTAEALDMVLDAEIKVKAAQNEQEKEQASILLENRKYAFEKKAQAARDAIAESRNDRDKEKWEREKEQQDFRNESAKQAKERMDMAIKGLEGRLKAEREKEKPDNVLIRKLEDQLNEIYITGKFTSVDTIQTSKLPSAIQVANSIMEAEKQIDADTTLSPEQKIERKKRLYEAYGKSYSTETSKTLSSTAKDYEYGNAKIAELESEKSKEGITPERIKQIDEEIEIVREKFGLKPAEEDETADKDTRTTAEKDYDRWKDLTEENNAKREAILADDKLDEAEKKKQLDEIDVNQQIINEQFLKGEVLPRTVNESQSVKSIEDSEAGSLVNSSIPVLQATAKNEKEAALLASNVEANFKHDVEAGDKDYTNTRAVLRLHAEKSIPASVERIFDGGKKLYQATFEMEKMVEELAKTDFDFGVLEGGIESIQDKIRSGVFNRNPLALRFATMIATEVENYARAKSGAAIPDTEWNRFLTIFPTLLTRKENNYQMIRGLRAFTYNDMLQTYEDSLGSRDAARFAIRETLTPKEAKIRKQIAKMQADGTDEEVIKTSLRNNKLTDRDIVRLYPVKGR